MIEAGVKIFKILIFLSQCVGKKQNLIRRKLENELTDYKGTIAIKPISLSQPSLKVLKKGNKYKVVYK